MTDVIVSLIQGLLDIEAEWERVGKPLDDRRKRQREMLRDAMLEGETIEAIDEISGHKALLVHQEADRYIPEKLLRLLPRPELANDIFQTVVDNKAVQALVDSGLLTRSQLIREGALVREPKTKPFVKLVPLIGVRP